MDPTEYYDLTIISSPAVSPDGERVAFLATECERDNDDRHTSLFVVPTDGSDEPYRLSRASDAGSPQWSPAGRYLGFTATRAEDTEVVVTSDRTGVHEGDRDGNDETDADGDADRNDDEPTQREIIQRVDELTAQA